MCNSLTWSIKGKYAIGAITGKPRTNPRSRIATLVIWSSAEETYWTIPKGNEFELTANILGLGVHPQIESLIVCGGSNGLIYLINVETCEILQSFRETGVWSHASEISAEIIDCVFAPSGVEFAVITGVGTLSFYGVLPIERFQATPVEQFFKSDYTQEEELNEPERKICNARMIEYKYQPPLPNKPDTEFKERFNFFKRELETYEVLEAEILKVQPNNNEERKIIIDYEESKQEEMQQDYESMNDDKDEDYVVNESQEGLEDDNVSEMSDLLSRVKKGRRRQVQEVPMEISYSSIEDEHKDSEYYLTDSGQMVADKETICGFCDKNEAIYTMIGPFMLISNTDNKVVNNKHLWIHKECLTNNDYIRVDNESYIGIKEVIDKVLNDSPIQCGRCKQKGCIIKCIKCYKWFHGHNCCNYSGVYLEDSNSKGSFKYYCYDCYGNYIIQMAKELRIGRQGIYAKLSRKWIINNKEHYIPQLYDQCYYFFQGHELFLKEYFMNFCKTEPESYPELPWKRYPDLLLGPVLCCIVDISYEFPDRNVICFSKQEFKMDYPSIFMKLKLLIENTNNTFELLYTNEDYLTEFLMLKEVYDTSKDWFNNKWKHSDHPLTFRIEPNIVTTVEEVGDLEKDTFANTEWRNILVKEESINKGISDSLRSKKGNYELLRLSYWNLMKGSEEGKEIQRLNNKVAMEIRELINKTINSNKDLYNNFMHDPTTIKNYLNVIPLPMYYDLICERLQHNYYRRVEAVIHDIKLITNNAKIFDHTMTKETQKGMVEILKAIYKYAIENKVEVSRDVFDGIKLVRANSNKSRKKKKVVHVERRISQRIAEKRKEKMKKLVKKLKESDESYAESDN